MEERSYHALTVEQPDDDSVTLQVRELSTADLPPGELLIQVAYSGVNYKDALACRADGGVVRRYPMVPGIDLAGTVAESADGRFRPGDQVLVTGYELGVSHPGGYGQLARVPAEWAVPLPTGLTAREAMILGTAGLTAALSVRALQGAGVRPESGPVLVTGASGGVGHAAITILARLGYEVAASTGKADMHARLRQLGATHLLSREELILEPAKPLDKQRWAGVIDTTGGLTLSRVLGAVRYGGAVAASGMAGGSSLQMSVYPFILRGVSLLGIDSVYATMDLRRELWSKLAGDWKPHDVESIAAAEIGLAEIPGAAAALLAGEARGRFVVRVQA